MSAPYFIDRPPRLQPELPEGRIEIPVPPAEEKNAGQLLLQFALPLISILGYLLMAVFGQGRSLLLMVPMGLSVILSITIALYTRYRNNALQHEKHAAYLEQLIELRSQMNLAHDIQRRHYLHTCPAPEEAMRIAAEAFQAAEQGQPGDPWGARLWERRAGDTDFCALRLGTGTLPSRVVYTLKDGQDRGGSLFREAARLSSDSQYVSGLPISIPLRPGNDQSRPPRHSLGVFGSRVKDVYHFMHAILVNYATFQDPEYARLYILGLEEAREAWRWASKLPHCTANQPGDNLCFEESADRSGPKEASSMQGFLRRLRKLLEERRLRLEDKDQSIEITLPQLLVVIDLLLPLPEGSALRNLETDPAVSLLLKEGQRLGAAVIFLAPGRQQVPGDCLGIIELKEGNQAEGTQGKSSFRYAEVGLNTPRYAGTADSIDHADGLIRFASALQPLLVRRTYGSGLPRSVHILDMLGVKTQEDLREKMLANWRRSQQTDAAEWLRSAFGVLSGGDTRSLTYSADADGVHGLIAGSTGSGKSELLMTMILSLAFQYDPTIVNFVLVDFKGGAAFEPFRSLPHCVDIVTNLHGNAVERMFAAIMAEIHRREALNVATGSKHIVHYRKNGLHLPPYGRAVPARGEGVRTAPYPHLFVFIDEFAEMIAENPEYKAQLNSITRLGRALGVSLILAAQRPTGVTDQMRANIKFRIALRVETREESGEVLRRPEAAYLPTGIPGRGYLQVGNENIELVQVAWSGAEFYGAQEGAPVLEKQPVIWHNRPRRRSGAEKPAQELPKVYEVMVNTMAELSRQHSIPQRKPWPDFLPDTLSLESRLDTHYLSPEGISVLIETATTPAVDQAAALAHAEETLPLNGAVSAWLAGTGCWPGVQWKTWAMRGVVGLVDHPEQAEQFPLVVDLQRGHAVVFGASGWGKTVFLRTLLTTLTVIHSPRELHIYILDFGGRQLSVFQTLPHLGGLIVPDENERVERLLRKLDGILEKRKRILSDAGADNLVRYNQDHPGQTLPAILVMIDNFAEFREGYEELLPLLVSIARESRPYGIHFVISAELPAALSGKLYNLFTERFALKLSDPSEYTAIVGRGARLVEDIPGRGYVQVGRQALAFQAALPVGISEGGQPLEETQRFVRLVSLMNAAGAQIVPAEMPEPVRMLDNRVLLANLISQPDHQAARRVQPRLGIDDRTLAPWRLDLGKDGPHLIVIGPPGSGKTTFLRSLALSLACGFSPDQVGLVLVDFQQRLFRYGGQHTLSELPHHIMTVSTIEEIGALVETLKIQTSGGNRMNRSIFVLIDNYDMFSEEARAARSVLPDLGALAREHGTGGLHFIIAGSPDSARLIDELRKQVSMPRLGIALESADLVATLNGRVPRGLAAAALPRGRGFVVKGGLTWMVQFATPYEDDEQPEASLDAWVERLNGRFAERRENRSPGEPAEARSGSQIALPLSDRADFIQPPASPLAQVSAAGLSDESDGTGEIDLDALKSLLLENNVARKYVDLLPANDLYKLAIELGLILLDGQNPAGVKGGT